MKSFLILLGDKRTAAVEQELLIKHVNYLKDLHDQGNLVTCGPLLDNQGAVIILRAESREHAEELIKNDPFLIEGHYQHYVLKEYLEASDDNNWLLEI